MKPLHSRPLVAADQMVQLDQLEGSRDLAEQVLSLLSPEALGRLACTSRSLHAMSPSCQRPAGRQAGPAFLPADCWLWC